MMSWSSCRLGPHVLQCKAHVEHDVLDRRRRDQVYHLSLLLDWIAVDTIRLLGFTHYTTRMLRNSAMPYLR